MVVKRKFHASLDRIAEERGLDEEGKKLTGEYVLSAKAKKFIDRVSKKYRSNLVYQAALWAAETLSRYELEDLNPEEMIILYAQAHPDQVKLSDIETILGKDGKGKRIPDPLDQEIDIDRLEWDGTELVEKPPAKPSKPSLPSYEESKKMSLTELKSIIDAHGGIEGGE